MNNIVNVYEAVDRNKRNSFIAVLIFALIISGITWAFVEIFGYGLWIVGVALIFAGLSGFTSYWYSDRIILSLHGARPADRKKDFDFFTTATNVSIGAGLPKPRLYVIEDPSPNAFATGRDPKNAVVCATSGLLGKLDRSEVEAVVGHEMAHIGNYDIRLMSIVAILAGMIVILADWFFRISIYGGRGRDRGAHPLLLLAGIALLLLSPFIAIAIKAAVSRRREFLADATGVRITRNPKALASALEKIAKDHMPLRSATKATAHLFIENPLKKHSKDAIGWLAGLFNTHPPTQERIKALQAMV